MPARDEQETTLMSLGDSYGTNDPFADMKAQAAGPPEALRPPPLTPEQQAQKNASDRMSAAAAQAGRTRYFNDLGAGKTGVYTSNRFDQNAAQFYGTQGQAAMGRGLSAVGDPYLAGQTANIGQEQTLAQQFQAQMRGTAGPSVANLQMQQGLQQNTQNAYNMAANAGPNNAGLGLRGAMMAQQQGGLMAAQQGAQLRAQEQQQAAQNYAGLLGSINGQYGQQYGALMGANNAQQQLNQQAQQANAGLAYQYNALDQGNQAAYRNAVTQNEQFNADQNNKMNQAYLQAGASVAAGAASGGMSSLAGGLFSVGGAAAKR